VASMLGVSDLHVASLSELRASLASAGVPSRDFFVPGTTFDLRREAGFLGLTESVLAPLSAGVRGPDVAASARVHPTAILRGAVALGPETVVEEGAVLIGPTVVGRGARIGRGATVAQCVVVPGTELPAGAVARQRVVTAAQAEDGALVDDPSAREPLGPVGVIREIDTRSPFERAYGLKAPVEAVIAAAALVLLSPLLAVIGAAVKLSSPGPVFYGDRREGRGGREFRCWKFRSMQSDAHARQRELADENQVDGPQFKIQEDPRITRIGRLLRRLNLDELPQLFNVVRGEMSLVGPRPSPFRENQICVPWRDGRLSVAPGITGLWQVCRDRTDSADFHQWIYYDLLYVNQASPWLDFKILLATVLTLGGRRRVPLRWLVGRLAASPDQRSS
jgi:lipopolysaccharide/colanic/teichoic acid biosynthesis glycosyltransferase